MKINAAAVSFCPTSIFISSSLTTSLPSSTIKLPFPVREVYLNPNLFRRAPVSIAITLATVSIDIAKANHSLAGLPVFWAHISDIGIAPAPVPPPIIGRT